LVQREKNFPLIFLLRFEHALASNNLLSCFSIKVEDYVELLCLRLHPLLGFVKEFGGEKKGGLEKIKWKE